MGAQLTMLAAGFAPFIFLQFRRERGASHRTSFPKPSPFFPGFQREHYIGKSRGTLRTKAGERERNREKKMERAMQVKLLRYQRQPRLKCGFARVSLSPSHLSSEPLNHSIVLTVTDPTLEWSTAPTFVQVQSAWHLRWLVEEFIAWGGESAGEDMALCTAASISAEFPPLSLIFGSNRSFERQRPR